MGTLPELEPLGPGSHVCCVVDSTAQFEAWTAECLAEGARRGEKLFRFAPQARLAGLPVDGAVNVADPHVAFLDEGPVDPAVMYAMFRRETAAARREGYQGLRLVADMDWLLASQPDRAALTAFEVSLDEVVRELGATVVCAYRTPHFDAATISAMVAVHPVTVGTVPAAPGFRIWNVAGGVWAGTGEVDYFNAEPFGRALTAAARDVSTLRLRTAGLRLIAAAGIEVLVQVARSRPDLRIVIEDANEIFRRCWALLDLDRQVPNVEFQPAPTGAGLSPAQVENAR
ncbi:MAG TPA: MEDS domain-containing protein [Pilimelia sp.]|nr:MEDS domain-containing protein [Pilimelia sp.]